MKNLHELVQTIFFFADGNGVQLDQKRSSEKTTCGCIESHVINVVPMVDATIII